MRIPRKLSNSSLIAGLFFALTVPAHAQDSPGALMPHQGGRVTTAFSNRFGPDAEGTVTFSAITPQQLDLIYVSTRGLVANRSVLVADRANSSVYVLGYAKEMPQSIPGSTSLGISGSTLVELRTSGKATLTLVYDANLARIAGQLTLLEKDIRVPLIVEGNLVQVPAVHASGVFKDGAKEGVGDFYFLDNKNNPLLIQSTLHFNWEKDVRSERITQVTAGASMKSAVEQSLKTLKRYDIYGLHFDFDRPTLRPESAAMIKDIAITLKNNPLWSLLINGHTDSIGDTGYNQKLSAERAASVAAALASEGIASSRLQTGGFGESKPKGDNATMQGRALNRRVELIRTDR
jgi:outer membrane protein OmpA-like peptidoglycan-associated protein